MTTPLLQLWLYVTVAATSQDAALTAGRAALAAGRPWEATRVVTPLLADTSRRTPDAVLLAATAASRWSGWNEVYHLLAGETWLDSLYGAEGRRLLVRAALERGADSFAAAGALRGLRAAPDSTSAELLVLLARALDRLDARDSAALVYQRAADRLPTIADWLRLRAVAVTDDSAARARLIAQLVDPLPQRRVPWSVAAARERAGDSAGAALAYAALGARVRALQLRLAGVRTDEARDTVRQELVALIRVRPAAADLRDAVALLDEKFAPLSAAEQLTVARNTGAILPARAADGYRHAFAAKLGDAADRFEYATALFRLGRYGEAAFAFNLIAAPRPLAASAAYQRARALIRDGQMSEGRSALTDVARKYPRDTTAAASALYLLADLATDRQEDAEARTLFQRVAARYPTSRLAAGARFRAAIIAFVAGEFHQAVAEFDELARRYPASEEATAAVYWAGRAFAAAGDTAAATLRWETVARRDSVSLSYYAGLSARRLGRAPWVPGVRVDAFERFPSIDSTLGRAALLTRLGFTAEARLEYRQLIDAGSDVGDVEWLLAAADALRRAERPADAIRLALRARGRGAPTDARLYRLLYPIIHQDALLAEAVAQQLDPGFVAALIRQESHFDAAAVSPAGARGMMQIMPKVGATLARSRDYPVWDVALLHQPDVSLELGVLHLRELAGRYATPARILAAYNAGATRVDRWSEKRGVDDPELFVERIPFTETRDYVRIIHRSGELYRALYPWPGGGPAGS